MQLTRQEHQEMLDETAKLRATIAALEAKVTETEKKLKEAENYRDIWHSSSEKHEKELAEAHATLDLFPDAPLRKSKEEDSYRQTTYSLGARISGWLAGRLGK